MTRLSHRFSLCFISLTVFFLILICNFSSASASTTLSPWPIPSHDAGLSFAASAGTLISSKFCMQHVRTSEKAVPLIPAPGLLMFTEETQDALTVKLLNTTTMLLSSFSIAMTNPFTVAVDSRGDLRLYAGSLVLRNESMVVVNVTAISLISKQLLWISVIETQDFTEFRYDTATDAIDLYYVGLQDAQRQIARVHGSSGAVLWTVPAVGTPVVNLPNGDLIITCSGSSICPSPQNGTAQLMCLEAVSGQLLWQQHVPVAPAYSLSLSHMALSDVLYTATGDHVYVISASSGAINASSAVMPCQSGQFPLLAAVWSTNTSYLVAYSCAYTAQISLLDPLTAETTSTHNIGNYSVFKLWSASSDLVYVATRGKFVQIHLWNVICNTTASYSIPGTAVPYVMSIDGDGAMYFLADSRLLTIATCIEGMAKAKLTLVLLVAVGSIFVVLFVAFMGFIVCRCKNRQRGYDVLTIN